jgi:hypothetical protein
MRRILFSTLAFLLVPLLAQAQTPNVKNAAGEVRAIPTVAPGEAKPASYSPLPGPGPLAIAPAPVYVGPIPVAPVGPVQPYPGAFSERLRAAYYAHVCAPDGCPSPIGCGNCWTEKKFIFGSCRQFFGTAESSVGHHRHTRIP